ncbi:unnamed protein product [Closterium sp. NIES-65]|nr:unnamed protein product [Closterium sp. NIES-65]
MGAEYLDAGERAEAAVEVSVDERLSAEPAAEGRTPMTLEQYREWKARKVSLYVYGDLLGDLLAEPAAEGRTPMTLEQYRTWKARKTREQAMAEFKKNPHDADNLTKLGRTLVELAQFIQGQESNEMLDDAVSKFDQALKIAPSRPDTLWWLGNAHTTRGFQTPDAQCSTPLLSFFPFPDAVSKFDEALKIAPSRPDTLWWLGNAHTTRGFQTPDATLANVSFEKASDCFRKALDADPSNDAYRKSLEISLKGPELHQEVQKQMALQQALGAAVHPSSMDAPKVLKQMALQQALGAAVHPSSMDAPKVQKKKKSSDLWYDVAGWVILSVGVVAWLSILSARAPPPAAAK